MFNPIFKENVQGRNILVAAHLPNQNYLKTTRKIKRVSQKEMKWKELP